MALCCPVIFQTKLIWKVLPIFRSSRLLHIFFLLGRIKGGEKKRGGGGGGRGGRKNKPSKANPFKANLSKQSLPSGFAFPPTGGDHVVRAAGPCLSVAMWRWAGACPGTGHGRGRAGGAAAL